jgi:hypothetical protein
MGMTVSELLARMDSRELSERMVAANLPWWQKHVADSDKALSQRLMTTLFGKALNKGAVKWLEKPK